MREKKIAYVAKQIADGFKSYYGIAPAEIEHLDDARLDIEYDCALNWAGDE